MACSCPSGWCYHRKGCRRHTPPRLVPDFAAGVMRSWREESRRGMQSIEQREQKVQAPGHIPSTLAWLNERKHAIEERLQTDLAGARTGKLGVGARYSSTRRSSGVPKIAAT